MSDKDSPFGGFGRGDRTVIVPNPGGRRPPAAVPQQPAYAPQPNYAPPPQSAAPQQQSYQQQGGQGVDDWISTPQRAPTGPQPTQRAGALNFDDLVAPHENQIMRAAGPLLLLLGRLRVAAMRASLASLMEQVSEAVKFFEKDIRSAGVAEDHANSAKYLICATADDIVQNIPTEDRHVWTQYSMLSKFFGERMGGVRFFEMLDKLKMDPVVNYNVLELQHACLALGFAGLHRSSPNGSMQLQQIQRNLYETLRRVRPKQTLALSPRWQGQNLAALANKFRVPIWAAAALTALLLFGGYLLLRNWIAARADMVAAETIGLHAPSKITLQRRIFSPPPKPAALPVSVQTQLQRIRLALAPEISAGSISVDEAGNWIAIRVGNLILFDSGQATVLPQFRPVAARIAQIVEKEAGPLKIIGHTDNVALNPSSRFKSNFDLSIERAKGVNALITPALSQPDRVAIDGKGQDQPIGDNKTAEGRSRNRRVEVLITKADK